MYVHTSNFLCCGLLAEFVYSSSFFNALHQHFYLHSPFQKRKVHYGSRKKNSFLMAGPLMPNPPPPPSSLMAVEILDRWKKRSLREEFFLQLPLGMLYKFLYKFIFQIPKIVKVKVSSTAESHI